MSERNLGSWILPQPVERERYVPIPKWTYTIKVPFGYEEKEGDEDWLYPIKKELDALELAKKYVKKYTYTDVAAWLTTQTGRSITGPGLKQRIKSEIERHRRAGFYRSLARRYKEALKKAQEYEERLGKAEKTEYFDSDPFIQLSRDWEQADRDSGRSGRTKHRRIQAKSGTSNSVSCST